MEQLTDENSWSDGNHVRAVAGAMKELLLLCPDVVREFNSGQNASEAQFDSEALVDSFLKVQGGK